MTVQFMRFVVCTWLAFAHASVPIYQDSSAQISERVTDLLSRMTLAEKAAQLVAVQGTAVLQQYANTSFGLLTVPPSVEERNAIQAKYMNGSRLHIPVAFFHESLHGGSAMSTQFPELVTLGTTWDCALVRDIYAAIAQDTRAGGAEVAFAPVLNLWTDPRNGRHQEGFSPDPTLTARMAEASVAGLQGDLPGTHADTPLADIENNVIALGKHYAAYGAAVGGLNAAPAELSERTLRDVYLKPWKAFAKAGGRGVMPAHNTVMDVPCHAHKWLVHEVLRGEYGFGDGISLSDCNDIGVLEDFGIAANKTHAAAKALNARAVDLDLQCGSDPSAWSYNKVIEAVETGLTDQAAVDDAVRRVLTMKFAAGLFERPFTPTNRPVGDVTALAEAGAYLARKAAHEGVVLVANKASALPLRASDVRSGALRIAVIGPLANGTEVDGAYIGSYATARPTTSVLSALQEAAPLGNITFEAGGGVDDKDINASAVAAAVNTATEADVAILVLGDTPNQVGEWKDRSHLDLLPSQLSLLDAVVTGSPATTRVVLVLVHGNQLTFGPNNAVLDGVDAILSAGRPGQQGGYAIVDLLLGKVSPSGRLASSWPRSVSQVGTGAVPFLSHRVGKWLANRRGDVDADGRRYDNFCDSSDPATPLFRFGWGLTYTNFSYSNLTASISSSTTVPVVLLVQVSNIGSRDGAEVVQAYCRDPVATSSNVVRYWKRLTAFDRIEIAAGETAEVELKLSYDELGSHRDDMSFGITPGEYECSVGGSSVTDTLSVMFFLS